MTHIKQAIEDAIKGGWPVFDSGPVEITGVNWNMIGAQHNGVYKLWPLASALIDPLFFQAIGKARGWKEFVCEKCGGDYGEEGCVRSHINSSSEMDTQLYHQHRLVDHLAASNDIESFFASL